MHLFPSLIAATHYTPLQIIALCDGMVDGYHIDIMDGIFVPTIGFDVVALDSIIHATKKPLWVHLMVQDPYHWISGIRVPVGATVTFHWQSEEVALALIRLLKTYGVRPSIALSPGIHPEVLVPLYPYIDHIVVMGVMPGVSGQPFVSSVMQTIAMIVHARNQGIFSGIVAVDGGVNKDTIGLLIKNGVEWCAVGSAIFITSDPVVALKELRHCAVVG